MLPSSCSVKQLRLVRRVSRFEVLVPLWLALPAPLLSVPTLLVLRGKGVRNRYYEYQHS
jgi:hypothetical protein